MYFATNVSSLVFRWIAWLIVISAMVFLAVFFIALVFAYRSLPLDNLPYSEVFGSLVLISTPVVILVYTVVSSWLIVLIAEFTCFISNVYHIVFNKVYSDDKSGE